VAVVANSATASRGRWDLLLAFKKQTENLDFFRRKFQKKKKKQGVFLAQEEHGGTAGGGRGGERSSSGACQHLRPGRTSC